MLRTKVMADRPVSALHRQGLRPARLDAARCIEDDSTESKFREFWNLGLILGGEKLLRWGGGHRAETRFFVLGRFVHSSEVLFLPS